MTPCFADSYYFFALLSPRDEAHSNAMEINARLRRPIVTTAWILTEVGDGLAQTPSRRLFVPLWRRLVADPRVTIVEPDQPTFERGIALFEGRPDKRWSLTDCISFVIMRDHGLTDALTADRHFEQAGINTLLTETR